MENTNTARQEFTASAMDLLAEEMLMSRFQGEIVLDENGTAGRTSPMMAGVLDAIRRDTHAA